MLSSCPWLHPWTLRSPSTPDFDSLVYCHFPEIGFLQTRRIALENAQDGSTNKRHFSARRSQTLSASFMFQPICNPASTKTHKQKATHHRDSKRWQIPFPWLSEEIKKYCFKNDSLGCFLNWIKKKKMCADVKTVYKPDSGCFFNYICFWLIVFTFYWKTRNIS